MGISSRGENISFFLSINLVILFMLLNNLAGICASFKGNPFQAGSPHFSRD